MTVHFNAHIKGEGIRRGVATSFDYPGGEWSLNNIESLPQGAVWIADVRGANTTDLLLAGMLADHAHSLQERFVLLLPYLPAARADRGHPLGISVYADFVNSFDPQQIITIDAHSPVAHEMYMPLDELSLLPLLQRALNECGHTYDGIIAPDHGAVDRAGAVAETLGIDLYTADKHRDFDTGKILEIRPPQNLPTTGEYLIVDDICDGGGTFFQLAAALGLPKNQLSLWITHGIFSNKAHELRDHYKNIYTTDSHPGSSRIEPGLMLTPTATVTIPVETYLHQHIQEF